MYLPTSSQTAQPLTHFAAKSLRANAEVPTMTGGKTCQAARKRVPWQASQQLAELGKLGFDARELVAHLGELGRILLDDLRGGLCQEPGVGELLRELLLVG